MTGNKILASGNIPLGGNEAQVTHAIYVPLVSGQPDNSEVRVNLVASNILKGFSEYKITATGKRPAYSQLYLVTNDGVVATLKPKTDGQDKFEGENLTLDTSFRFRIAEKINSDGSIDFSGDVYGNVNGKLAMIDETGESAFVYSSEAAYTKAFVFDPYTFRVSTLGSELSADDLALSSFGEADISGETFRTLKRSLEKGKTYTVIGKLADKQNIYNPDFFERKASDKVKFIGKTGEYTLYFNPVRKNMIVGVEKPSYPDYLLACGLGLGYPTEVSSDEIAAVYAGRQRTHTEWGFDHVLKYVLLPRISDGVYQGTFYTPADRNRSADFKPFENTGWANEKKAGTFTFTGEKIISGDNNWKIANGENDPVIESANYRFTIDLNKKTVHIEKVTL